jgi:glycosyltransferase involved in cell wall biosynthesis
VFGRLVQQTGVDVLLAAFPRVQARHPTARLLIVGDGPLRATLEAQAAALGLGEAVIFTGWRDDARALMPACDAVGVPSRWEGFGLVTLEAMGCTRPVIASRVSALPEIVQDGETGLLVPPDDPPALAEAITKLLDDPDRAAALGRAGYERLQQHFSVEAMAQATLDVYTAVIQR